MIPGANYVVVGGMFMVGWLSGKLAFNRNEDDYLERTKASGLGRGGDKPLSDADRAAAEAVLQAEAEAHAAAVAGPDGELADRKKDA